MIFRIKNYQTVYCYWVLVRRHPPESLFLQGRVCPGHLFLSWSRATLTPRGMASPSATPPRSAWPSNGLSRDLRLLGSTILGNTCLGMSHSPGSSHRAPLRLSGLCWFLAEALRAESCTLGRSPPLTCCPPPNWHWNWYLPVVRAFLSVPP